MNRRNVDITSSLSLLIAPLVALAYLYIIGYASALGAPRLDSVASLLAADLFEIQSSYPIVATLVTALFLVMGAVLNVMVTARYSLFGTASQLPMALYAIFVSGFTISSMTLSASIAALVGVFALRDLFRSYGNSARTSKLFTATLWMGLLPLLYPTTIVLWLGAFAMLLLFVKSLREGAVVAIGLASPILTYTYVKWLMGGDLTAPLMEFWSSLTTAYSHPSPLWDSVAAYPMSILIIASILVLFSLLQIDRLSLRFVARTRLRSSFIFVALGSLMLLLPSFSIEACVALASPLSIAVAPALLRLRGWISVVLLVAMGVLSIWYLAYLSSVKQLLPYF